MQMWLAVLASCVYLIAAGMFFRVARRGAHPMWALGGLVLACQLHAFGLIEAVKQFNTLNLSVFNVVSIVAWSVACLAMVWLWRASLALAGVVIALINALVVVLPLVFVSEKAFLSALPVGMLWHILTAIAAWTVLTIAMLHALLYGVMFSRLKQKRLARGGQALSLVGVERVFVMLMFIGVVFLGASLATGWVFVEDLFAQHLWHKTVLTMLSWGVYVWVLWGYFFKNERGLRVMYGALVGYGLLLVGYVVSNIVLQFVVAN